MSYSLITGGAGYIGSHIAQKLLKEKKEFLIVDNLSRSTLQNIKRLEVFYKIKIPFFKINILDEEKLDKIFKIFNISSVIHLAAYKSIKESIEKPQLYIKNNVDGTKSLLKVMLKNNCNTIIYSSSASVYGNPNYLPIDETHPVNPLNPYSSSKLEVEKILETISKEETEFRCVVLRYFNPIGSYRGIIVESLNKYSTNLMPAIIRTALKKQKTLEVYGDDFNTKDGYAVRDFIHVCDLSEAHTRSLNFLKKKHGYFIFNVGTGNGFSVREVYETFKKVNKIKLNVKIKPRRIGDIDSIFSESFKSEKILKWRSKSSLRKMCEDAWSFYINK